MTETELVVLVSAYLVEPTAEAALGRAHRRLYRADRSGNPAAGPPERGLQEKTTKPLTPAGRGPGRLCRALGEIMRMNTRISVSRPLPRRRPGGGQLRRAIPRTPTHFDDGAVNHPIAVEPSYQST